MDVKRNVVNTIRQVVEVIGKYAGGSLPEPAKDKVKGFILSLPGRWSVAVKDAGLGDGWEVGTEDDNPNGDATGTSSARSPPSSTNPRKRNRMESSSQSIVSESGASSSGMTVVGGLSARSSSTNLASTSRVGSSSGAPTAPGVKRSQLLPPTTGAARHAAHRVLTLAQESLHAVRGVTNVFKETLERAETYVILRLRSFNSPILNADIPFYPDGWNDYERPATVNPDVIWKTLKLPVLLVILACYLPLIKSFIVPLRLRYHL
jgi:hypothetical protein